MTFNWTLDLGQLVNAALFLAGIYGGVLRVYHLLDKRLSSLERMLSSHADTLTGHADRMDRYEAQILRVVGDLQRLIGRIETVQPWRADFDPERRR